jgi:hypothetical protein
MMGAPLDSVVVRMRRVRLCFILSHQAAKVNAPQEEHSAIFFRRCGFKSLNAGSGIFVCGLGSLSASLSEIDSAFFVIP